MADSATDDSAKINVEVCYALPGSSFLKALKLDRGTTVAQAIDASGVLRSHPPILKCARATESRFTGHFRQIRKRLAVDARLTAKHRRAEFRATLTRLRDRG